MNTLTLNSKVHVTSHKRLGILVEDTYGDGEWYGVRLDGDTLLTAARAEDITPADGEATCNHLYFVAATHKDGYYCRGCGRWTFEMPSFN